MQNPLFDILSVRLGFEGGFSVRKLAEKVKRTVTSRASQSGVIEQNPYSVSLNFVKQDRQEQLALDHEHLLEVFGAGKETKVSSFMRPGELDLPLLRQAMALTAREIRRLDENPRKGKIFPEVFTVLLTQDSDLPLWAAAASSFLKDVFGVPLTVILDHIFLASRVQPGEEVSLVNLNDLCADLARGDALPYSVLNSEMFPTLPTIREVTMDMTELGRVGSGMLDSYPKMSTQLNPNQVKALKLYIVATSVPESKIFSIVRKGTDYLQSTPDKERTKLAEFISETGTVGVAGCVGRIARCFGE